MKTKNIKKNQKYPKISIIIPSLNQGEFIEQTIKSILDQNYPNLELIIIDGGSTDNTLKVIKKYQDKIFYFVSEKDRGQSDAINKGMARATGEILAYLNSDDYYLPGSLQKVADIFSKQKIDMLYSDVYLVNTEGNFLKYLPALVFRPKEYVYGVFSVPQQGAFWTEAAYKKVGQFRVENHADMDGEFFLHLSLAGGSFYFIKEPLACFRMHNRSKTGTKKYWKTFSENFKNERKEVLGSNPPMFFVTLKVLFFRFRNLPYKTYRRLTAPKLPKNLHS